MKRTISIDRSQMNGTLNGWLGWNKREPCPYSQFQVIDVREVHGLSQDIKTYLVDSLRVARFDLEFLKDMAKHLGWERVNEQIVAGGMPRLQTMKRGDFGEVLFASILKEFHSYKIPVPKLRFKITRHQSLPATDILALKMDGSGSVVEVCFAESKLRTSSDNMAAVEGYEQLQNNYECRLPDILKFVAARLHDRNDPLFHPFASYMQNRTDTTDKDTFRLGLCWEHSEWREKVLENLEENAVDLPRFTLHVIGINGLRQIIDELFAQLGVGEVVDDD